VRKIKPSELQEKTCHQFDCAIKTVIRHRAIDFYRAIRRSEKKEMPFAEIMDDLLNSIGTEDTYSTDYVAVFEVCGEKVSIEDEQLARALKAIEERKRNIVLQYFFIGDTDTYIGKMLDCSRANVTKCRIQALDKLKQLIEEEKEKCQKS
jgi:DNA-directed RNA polymerase specialized sigma24 family protein